MKSIAVKDYKDDFLDFKKNKEIDGRKKDKKERREGEGKGKRTQLSAEFQRVSRGDRKAFLNEQCKEVEDIIEWERLEISSRKLEISRKYFTQGWAQ